MSDQPAKLFVRPALFSDLNTIVDFHVKIWRETYFEHVSKDVFLKLDHDHRRPFWEKYLNKPETGQQTHIATFDHDTVGLISFGPTSDPEFNGSAEIKHLYVDSSLKRAGIGSRLMRLAFSELHRTGFDRATLSLLKQNKVAQAFYSSIGGVRIGSYVDPGPVWKSEGYLYSWSLPHEWRADTPSKVAI